MEEMFIIFFNNKKKNALNMPTIFSKKFIGIIFSRIYAFAGAELN